MTEMWAKIAQQIGGGSRTDVLRSLVWPNAMLLAALIWLSSKGAPVALLVFLGILLTGFMLLYAGAYIAFGLKDPNLLRSEQYNIKKMAIERGMLGDSSTGLVPQSDRQMTQLAAPKTSPDEPNE
jgi:hypothetical protein